MNELEKRVLGGELQKIVLCGGCFWCTEASFNPDFGVEKAISGYFGGKIESPTYEMVAHHETDHREAVIVYFKNDQKLLKKIIVNFFHGIDPVQPDGQFADIGFQYTTAIYYFSDEQKLLAEKAKSILDAADKFEGKKVATEILDGRGLVFYEAEDYHQEYADKNPLRYGLYKNGSGRSKFIKENWDGDKTFDEFLKD